MQVENAPSAIESPQGRRVLVAIVDGTAGSRIQTWRMQYDPQQAKRIPPHATLCYWVTGVSEDQLDRQVRHAFPAPVPVQLGGIGEFVGKQHSLFVTLKDTQPLDHARSRLYDGTHLDLGPAGDWTWHVTCVRDASPLDIPVVRAAALREFSQPEPWLINHIACLELQGGRYVPVAEWRL